MGIVAKVPSGAILTLSLSFNNDGPLGSVFRYICDNGTFRAYYDDLSDGKDQEIDSLSLSFFFFFFFFFFDTHTHSVSLCRPGCCHRLGQPN